MEHRIDFQAAGRFQPSERDTARSWYTLGILTFSFALAYVDRQMLNLLVDPIKRSLTISDTQFSLVQGMAFVTAYLCAAPIFGRMIDVANRRNVLIFGVAVWSGFTALCGLADSYAMLFLSRLGVGVSEACILPVAMSLIGDYFSPRRTARAQSIFFIGANLGGGISLLAGGAIIAFADDLRKHVTHLAALESWQMAFVVIGVPGLLFALFLFTLREPQRQPSPVDHAPDQPMTLREVMAVLHLRRHFYGRIYLAIGMLAIVQLGMPSWFPAFLIRAHGLSTTETGYQLGLIAISCGTAGTLLGPLCTQWLSRRSVADAQLRASAWAMAFLCLFCLAIPLAPGPHGALAIGGAIFFATGFPLGITSAAMFNASPSRMRGVVAALYTFVAQIIGYMAGPTLIATCTDRIFADPKMVGYSMQIVMSSSAFIATLLMFSALRYYREIAEGTATPSAA
ncbi:MAG: MFS transporter [Sphingobium sp.]